ncbi:MAG: DUF5658 family protein [Planctomycetota bacterium]|nr:DUF5658 family protein [Planctomycetota bacterium]
MTASSDQPDHDAGRSPWSISKWSLPVRHPNLYLWLIFVSALDVILTRVVLFFGGKEINPVADFVLLNWGRLGMSLFKFMIIGFVIIVCEYLATRNATVSRRLAIVSIMISLVPVVWSCIIIIMLILNPPVEKDGILDEEGYEVRLLMPASPVSVNDWERERG